LYKHQIQTSKEKREVNDHEAQLAKLWGVIQPREGSGQIVPVRGEDGRIREAEWQWEKIRL